MKSPLEEAIAIANQTSLPQADWNQPDSPPPAPCRDVYSISRLNREARGVLDGSFPLLWVEGELSNLSQPRSGHWYFSLKDEAAQVRCAMFRNRNRLLKFLPQNGSSVLARVQVSLYEGRGEFQLLVEHMEPAGDGALRRAFEDLKTKLGEEGLFNPQHKNPLPSLPQRIAVITSSSGAALHDILTTIERRMPLIPVDVYPSTVQGEAAAPQLIQHLQTANRHAQNPQREVIILARGGGSLEDLWAFNNEALARVIHDSKCPVITGIGHEIDFTIADFVADQRAATPTAAAELVCPAQTDLRLRIVELHRRIETQLHSHISVSRDQQQRLTRRLQAQHPARQLFERQQQLDRAQMGLQRPMTRYLDRNKDKLQHLNKRLQLLDPIQRLQTHRQQLSVLGRRLAIAQRQWLQGQRTRYQSRLDQAALQAAMQTHLHRQSTLLALLANRLHAVSPLATLSRGYAILSDGQQGVIDSIEAVKTDDTLNARVEDGNILCRVIKTTEAENTDD